MLRFSWILACKDSFLDRFWNGLFAGGFFMCDPKLQLHGGGSSGKTKFIRPFGVFFFLCNFVFSTFVRTLRPAWLVSYMIYTRTYTPTQQSPEVAERNLYHFIPSSVILNTLDRSIVVSLCDTSRTIEEHDKQTSGHLANRQQGKRAKRKRRQKRKTAGIILQQETE